MNKINRDHQPGLPCPIVQLVPHRAAMLFPDRLQGWTANAGLAGCRIRPDNIFLRTDGTLDPVVLVEIMAQVTAAHSGFESRLNNSAPKVGFLVGVKPFHFRKPVSVGHDLKIHISKDTQFDKVSYVSGTISTDSVVIAEGTLKLWEDEAAEVEQHPQQPQAARSSFKPPDDLRIVLDQSPLNRSLMSQFIDLKIDKQAMTATCRLQFMEDFPGFNGHFPGQPILPGVMMLKTGSLVSSLILGRALPLREISQAKFARSVFPAEEVDVTTAVKRGDEGWNARVQFSRQGQICAKFSMRFGSEYE